MSYNTTEKEMVLNIAARLVERNLTPSATHSRLENVCESNRQQIVKIAVATAIDLVAEVNLKFPR
jgi:hypothetical protein